MFRNAARHTAQHITRNTPKTATTAKNIARMTTSATNNAANDAAAARRRMDMETIKAHFSLPASAEERAWRAPSEGMTSFHNSHKWEFNHAYQHAEDLDGKPLASFLRQCYGLVVHLGNHHRIEEAHIFPLLAHKHPSFARNAEHEDFHHQIHDGLERYSKFLREGIEDPSKYSAAKLRETLDSFRKPLFEHLDKEVEDLRPENLKKHGFTLAEIRRLPFH
ncbi:hypothetical protein A1Q2_04492 [Trichosporon asahii var. asahii CBS 8904]|uniref:Hemerythrin-like domain-containing protein n=2 Tax=Trichosporon asahii var. asahii TaxID=189963 RepID=K1WIF9_TRIAC|nr:hypothetical protein A1Q1_03734 [Trichosporon asahii var. asahii CBS 2479]EJT47479.1 hypothetical protein A1Q1_03734 [Trichosporon asahii var. asahii CBS 2479]EKD01169.1 hypothetical protein A1Q2_04492 [Trichosporon asahii var. asahii CBS 8904]